MTVNTKALILKGIPYGENDRILTLFVPSLGKISSYAKSCPFLQPLSLIEANLSPGKRELYRLTEVTLLDPFLALRDHFPPLKVALRLAEAVNRFLPPELPKPHLFDLLLAYLTRLPKARNPDNFYYSFILKMHHVEGFLDPDQVPASVLPLITSRRWNEIDSLALSQNDLLFLQQEPWD